MDKKEQILQPNSRFVILLQYKGNFYLVIFFAKQFEKSIYKLILYYSSQDLELWMYPIEGFGIDYRFFGNISLLQTWTILEGIGFE